MENWEQLTQRADTRKTNLEQSRELQRFLADLRDLVNMFAACIRACTCVFGLIGEYSISVKGVVMQCLKGVNTVTVNTDFN